MREVCNADRAQLLLITVSQDEYNELLLIRDRYNWLKQNTTERMIDTFFYSDHHPGCEYVFPTLVSWKEFCGQISIDEAIDLRIDYDKTTQD